ncbi:hypothetical protein [Chlorobium ferrooxidans]|uniref:Uncharacterized protein n=1 Tax=Chlorobium ferrooxidans DSM 13031 TaxID=377431 RepID=Q0YRX9_9CHLB|nr:hypothetical protein [Chlorobium ferrooxidans]EAT59009.1 conserved hypothetical protein [Chlorobium ferrooxidans DSM 13031]
MSTLKKDSGSPDKYDIFIRRIDHFQSLVEEKKNLQAKITFIQQEYQEKIRPLEEELAGIIKKLEANLSKLEGGVPQPAGTAKFSRGQLGMSIKDLLRANPQKTFKPREIAEGLNTKGTTVSLWFNKYGVNDPEIDRVPAGKDGKRFVYKIK